MVPVAERISRQPWPECHDVLHVGSLVLSVSKYLIRLSNTSEKDLQRARDENVSQGVLCADDRPIGGCDSKEVANGVCQCAGKPLQVKAAAGSGLPMQRLDSLKTARFVLNPVRPASHEHPERIMCLVLRSERLGDDDAYPVDRAADALHAAEPAAECAKVVNLASWSDDSRSGLEPHELAATEIVVTLGSRH